MNQDRPGGAERETLRDIAAGYGMTEGPSLRVGLTGASGLVGKRFRALLAAAGHKTVSLVRREAQGGEVFWDPEAGRLNPASLRGLDALVHLAGENVASGRWNRRRKTAILESRVKGTELLASALAELDAPPGVFVSASAVGFYGTDREGAVTEASDPGRGFPRRGLRRLGSRRGVRPPDGDPRGPPPHRDGALEGGGRPGPHDPRFSDGARRTGGKRPSTCELDPPGRSCLASSGARSASRISRVR